MSLLIDLLFVLVALLFVLGVSLVLYARWNYGTLEAMGIPVVKPHWLLGSNPNHLQMHHHWEDVKRTKELGPIYGVYSGRTPEVFVSDLEMVRRIYFTDSDHFADKRAPDFGHPVMNETTELLSGEKWRTMRSALSPLFTTGKIKSLAQNMDKISKEYVGALVKEVDASGGRLKIDLSTILGPLAIQVIAECLCGITVENARDPNNTFVKQMRVAMFEDFKFDYTFTLTEVFPFLTKFFPTVPKDLLSFFEDAMKGILDGREKSGVKIPDTVNCILEMRQKLNSAEYKRIGITLNTVYGQALNFFVASYFGLVGTYRDMTYHLVTNPKVNKKLMGEIDSVLEKSNGETIGYEDVAEMHYLSGCVSETLRKTPGFFRPDRICTKDWEYEGYRIKKGTPVFIPMYPVHHNPELFPEPDKFIPDRFLPENKDKLAPCSFLAFGQGPRQCLGMRFVYEWFKIFTVNLLKEFTLEKRSDTVWNEHPGNHFMLTKDPIYIDLVRR